MGDDFKDRLERLHDSRRRADERADKARGDGVYRADDVDEHRPDDESPSDASEPEGADEVPTFPGAERVSTPEGPAFRRRHDHDAGTSYGNVTLGHARRHATFEVFDQFVGNASHLSERGARPTVAYFDTETTGLDDSSYAFCVGIGRWKEGRFVVTHHLIAHPDQEAAMLLDVAEVLEDVDLVCSFNGDNYDLPLLERRAEAVDVPSPVEDVGSLDLLPAARAALADLDSHTLQNLEVQCLERKRTDDIPGAEIPSRWNEFLRSDAGTHPDAGTGSEAGPLEPVLEHNRLDVVALAALTFNLGHRLASTEAGGTRASDDTRGASASDDSRGASASDDTRGASASDDSRGASASDDTRGASALGAERPSASESASQLSQKDPANSDVASKLERTYRLRERSGRRDGTSNDSAESKAPEDTKDNRRVTDRNPDPSEDEPRESRGKSNPRPDVSPGERVAELRRRADEHLAAERTEAAVPLLREILALEPRHPFALEKLASYHRRHDRDEFADHYEARLEDVSPF